MFSFDPTDSGAGADVYSWVLAIPVDRHPEPCWPGLWELEYPDDEGNPFLTYGVNNGDGEFFHLLRAMAWVLGGAQPAVVGNYYRDEVAHALGRPRDAALMTTWEYQVDESEPDLAQADKGYVKARACVPNRPAPDTWQAAHADRAGLFPISTFQHLTAVDVAVAGDASSEITLYGLPDSGSPSTLAAALNTDEPPPLPQILHIADTLIDLTQVRDLYSDGASRLLIHSRTDHAPRLREIEGAAEQGWNRYQETVPRLRTWDDFHQAMAALVAPVLVLSTT